MPTLKTTPVLSLPIVAKVRSTRKGQQLEAPLSGKLGGKGVSGVHYYDVTIVGGKSVSERLSCSCPAHRYGRAKMVKQTGMCKHLHKVIQTLALDPSVERTDKGDVIVYAPEAIRALATR